MSDLQERLEKRLDALRTDFEAGQQRLATLDEEAQQLRQTLFRISGAIQVLEEEIHGPFAEGTADAGTPR